MGLIKADQARNAAGTGNIDLFKQWASKVWATWNGVGTVAIRDSRNVTSLTDVGVGLYDVNFISALTNSSYAVAVTTSYGSATEWSSNSTTKVRSIGFDTPSGSASDSSTQNVTCMGDLA